MLKQAFDQESVHHYVEAVRSVLGRDELRDAVARAAVHVPGDAAPHVRLSAAMASPGPGNQSSGGRDDAEDVPYMSRNPVVSLVQSAIEEQLHDAGVVERRPTPPDLWHRLVHTVEEILHPGAFTPDDPNWVLKVAESMLGHLARGNHPFNPAPAGHRITDSARLVVVGDWGTGLPRAQAVATNMAKAVAEGQAAGRDVHVVHLGDIYYSGLPSENRRNVLAHWPVSGGQADAGVTSWSLNGNHDMYSGGYGYFQTLLADARFGAQHSPDGKPTSYFRLTSPSWDLVGLDTSWSRNVFSEGAAAVLEDPQAGFVRQVAAESGRKLVLFSHHQLVTVYDPGDIGPELTRKLGPVLDTGRVTAWWWGHEHRSMGFKPAHNVRFPRCLGHGGVPVLQPRTPADPLDPRAEWEDRSAFESGGQQWARFGHAVIDLDGPAMSVRYVDETGEQVRAENIG